jgi:cytochrome c oxidase assembly protein subunit 15
MNDADWQIAFEKYRQIGQSRYINAHFSLSDFKYIFFWEWLHRNWARLIGVVFAIPFIYFLVKGYFKKWMVQPLVILFLLGALQGAIGWVMVQTGLNPEDIHVSHISLAAHFIAAMVLTCYALVFAMMLKVKLGEEVVNPSLKNFTAAILVLLTVQLIYGAFMAGLKAAPAAATWPDMNGVLMPAMSELSWTNDPLAVQFIHRTLAYVLLVALVIWWMKAKKNAASLLFTRTRNIVLSLVVLQVVLGILSVISALKLAPGRFGRFEWLALSHQLVGMLLLLAVTAAFYLLRWSYRRTS